MILDLPSLSQETVKLSQEIIHLISNDLHEYYTDELHMNCYASRQAQLFKQVYLAQILGQEKLKMLKAKNIFDFDRETYPWCHFDLKFYDFINKLSL